MITPKLSFDTIHIYHRHSKLSKELIESIRQNLKNFKEHYNHETNRYSYSGRLKNSRVAITDRGIYIKGSIAKYVLSNNIETLSDEHIRDFFEDLYLIFGIPPDKWKLTRMDIGLNLILQENVEAYLNLIGGARYKTLNHAGTTLYLKSIEKVICIYDKIKEVKKDPYRAIPVEYKNKNILRIEFRILKNISKHLKYNQEPTLDKLLDSQFTNLCTQYCQNEFANIRFLHVSTDIKKIRTPKELEEFLLLKGVESMGMAQVEKFIRVLRKAKAFRHKTYYSRFLNSLKDKIKKHSIAQSNPLVDELLDKVNQFLNF